MIKKTIILLGLINMMISCKVTDSNIIGTYSLNHFPKTTFKINNDKTFEFIKNNPNPYLHPFDHPLENYFITRGIWELDNKGTIYFTSSKDSIFYDLFKIDSLDSKKADFSNFTFLDTNKDTIPILYVMYSDSSLVAQMHNTMPSYTEDLTKRDTLEFHFYGYRPWKFIHKNLGNKDFQITLIPEYRPGFFDSANFKISKNKLFDNKCKTKFRKIKNGR